MDIIMLGHAWMLCFQNALDYGCHRGAGRGCFELTTSENTVGPEALGLWLVLVWEVREAPRLPVFSAREAATVVRAKGGFGG